MGHGSGLQVRFKAVLCVSFWAYSCLEHVFSMVMAEAPETQPKPYKHISHLHFHPLASPWSKQVMMGMLQWREYIFSLYLEILMGHMVEKR